MKYTFNKYVFGVGLLLLVNCAPSFIASKPTGFALYKNKDIFKAISSDGIIYRSRTEKNKPQADFKFWREALVRHLTSNGYRLMKDSSITIDKQDAVLLELTAPLNNEDYLYFIAMTVKGKRILITEAAGKVVEMDYQRDTILQAISRIKL